jgi:chromosome partitioning protein
MKAGQRVATVDLDSRQKSLTHYIENRRAWANRSRLDLEVPMHYCVARCEGIRADENEMAEFSAFAETISSVETNHDFVVVDTPGVDSYLMRLAHSMADTLITPLNDSFVDFDVLGTVDPATYALTGTSHYSEMVREARRHRRLVDQEATDWIVVRNRLSTLGSRNKRLIAEGLNDLGLQLGFRSAEGFAERVIYREFFPRGLTALDDIDELTLGTRPNLSHVTAREEVQALLTTLRLPIDEKGRRRAAARSEWFAALERPLEVHDILD